MQQLWLKLPVVLRAVIAGAIVLVAGILPWSLLVSANLKFGASFPWASVVQLGFLAVIWEYLRGKGWPASTAEARRRRLRANRVSGRLLVWSMIAGSLFACGLIGLAVLGWMLVRMPLTVLDEFAVFDSLPTRTVVPLLLTGSIVAGFVEEAAFRGYMQVPIEERHGPAVGIWLVASVFALAHFPPLLALPGFILGALGWGILARLTNSILPGAILHTLTDAVVWIWAWSHRDSLKRVLSGSVLEGNSDLPFGFAAVATVLFGIAATLAFWKLASLKTRHRPA